MGFFLTTLTYFFLVSIAAVAVHMATTLAGKYLFMFPVTYSVSMYTVALTQAAGWNAWVAFGFGLLAALLFGVLCALVERRLPRDSFAVFGIATLLASGALISSWTSLTNGVLGIAGIHRPEGFESLKAMAAMSAVCAALVWLLEWVLLKSKLSRHWRGMKESTHLLLSMGIDAKRLSFATIVLACGLLGLGSGIYVWFFQFLTPDSAGSLSDFMRVLTIAILATQPKVSQVIWSTVFVVGVPELLRFLDLPAAVMGPLRSIFYSIFLILVLLFLQKRTLVSNRSV